MSKFISVKEQNPDRKYFTILPNILSRIDLTAFERSLYWAIKECCGATGSCKKSYDSLAKISGMSKKSVQRTLLSLAETNKHIFKPLILITNRLTENGDKDTNEIVLTDLWDDNCKVFKEIIGQVTQTSPQVNKTPGEVTQTRGVRSHRPDLRSHRPINKINKIPIEETTTTTTNKSSSSSFSSDEIKQEAQKAFDFLTERAKKHPEENWNLDLATLEKQYYIHGIFYVRDQFNYLLERMNKYFKNKEKHGNKIEPIGDPKIYFCMACKENYANSLHKETKEAS